MNKWKKAISAGVSATMVASLFTFLAASSALGAVSVVSVGNIPVGGTSANTATFTFTEQSATAIATNASGSFTVTLAPATVTFVGTPSTAGSTGSLGATASIAGNVLTINIAGSDTANVESIIVSGLKLKAATGTATGAVTATMGAFAGSLAAGAGIFSGGGTATGTIATGIGIGATSVIVSVTSAGCNFSITTTSGNPLSFATSAETKNITAATGLGTPAIGQQTLTIVATASAHSPGEVVSETTGCAASTALASPGTVVNALAYSSPGDPSVFPGENNSPAASLTLVEPVAGFLPSASSFTFTIATPGVVFSTAPAITGSVSTSVGISSISVAAAAVVTTTTAHGLTTGNTVTISGSNSTPSLDGPRVVTVLTATTFSVPVTTTVAGTAAGFVATPTGASGMVLSAPVVSADRKSATVTVTTASSSPATIILSSILYDVAATVPGGTFISVGVTTSGSLAVLPTSNTNAVVFRGIVASAPSPTVYIGENNQTAGVITFTESQPGFFTAGVGTGTNVIEICPAGVTYTFTLAPVAMVVGGTAAGNMILRDGSAASTTNIVTGIQAGNCYFWYVWTASTTASTIKIGAAPSAATGPLINVTVAQAPGGVSTNLLVGSTSVLNNLFATVQFATATYRNQVAVTALSQPSIVPGSAHAASGNLQVAETGLGQLKAGEDICVEVVWRSFVNQDTFLNSLNTADLPVATASGTGLVISPVNASERTCDGQDLIAIPNQYMQSFTFTVLQQSTAGDGKVVISNINLTTLADAPTGPVLLSVWGLGRAPTTVIFHSTVSNARIGSAQVDAWIAKGNNTRDDSAFSLNTVVVKQNSRVTFRFAAADVNAGTLVTIWVKTKTTAWKVETHRRVTGDGFAYYSPKVLNKGYRYYRVSVNGNISNTVRAFGN